MACELKKYNYDTMIPCSGVFCADPRPDTLSGCLDGSEQNHHSTLGFATQNRYCNHLQHKLSLFTPIGEFPEKNKNIPEIVIFNGKIEKSLRSSVRKKSLTKIPDNVANAESSVEKKRKKSVTFSNTHYIRFIDNRFTILSENDVNELWYNAVDFMNIRISAELEAHYFKLENPKINNDKFFLKRLWSGTNFEEYKNNIVINSITTFCRNNISKKI